MKRRTKERRPPRAKESQAVVRAVPLNQLTRRRVVMAQIPYSEGGAYKVRPAVVIRTSGRAIWVSPITTKSRGNVPIDLSGTGLSRRSFLRLDLVELDRMEIISVLGEIGDEEWATLEDRFPGA